MYGVARRRGELPSLFAEPVMQMTVGDIGEPIVSGNSIRIIELLEQRGAGVQKSKQAKVAAIYSSAHLKFACTQRGRGR